MTLVEHLRELRGAAAEVRRRGRARHDRGLGLLRRRSSTSSSGAVRRRWSPRPAARAATVVLALTGVADAFTLQLQIAAVTGLVLAAPVWLYQLWRFITPGLHSNEKRWAYVFAAVPPPRCSSPAWRWPTWSCPRRWRCCSGFTPENVENIVSVDRYLLLPAHDAGLRDRLPAARSCWSCSTWPGSCPAGACCRGGAWIIFGVFVFAAIATPTGDPINMLLLAVPDAAAGAPWRSGSRCSTTGVDAGPGPAAGLDEWADDETSPLDGGPRPADDRSSWTTPAPPPRTTRPERAGDVRTPER